MAKFQIDDTELKILAALAEDARTPFLEIARDCGISGAAIHQRYKKLQSMGVIKGTYLIIDPTAIGLNICAFVEVNLSPVSKYNAALETLKNIPEIVTCHFVTGKNSLVIKLYCADNTHLLKLLNTIQQIDGVQNTETLVSLGLAFERQIWIKGYTPRQVRSARASSPKKR